MLTKMFDSNSSNPSDFLMLRTLIEEASEAGARRALDTIGLDDEQARRDVQDLRDLLGAWRDVRRSALQGMGRWLTRALLAILLLSLVYRVDLSSFLKG